MEFWVEDAGRLVDEVLNALLSFMSSTGLDLRVEPAEPGERIDLHDPFKTWRRVLNDNISFENMPKYLRDTGMTHATRVVTQTRPSRFLTDQNRRFVMADACVLVTQIVARALIERGVKGVSVGECLFRVDDSMDMPALLVPKPRPGYRLLHVVTDRSAEGLGKVLAHSVIRVDGFVVDLLAPALGNGRSNSPFVWPDDLRERQHPENTGTYANWRKVSSDNQNSMLRYSLVELFEALMFADILPYFEHQENVLLRSVRCAMDTFVSARTP